MATALSVSCRSAGQEGRLGPSFADRRQEIVFIGQGLDKAGAREALDACLLDDRELAAGPSSWLTVADRWARWR